MQRGTYTSVSEMTQSRGAVQLDHVDAGVFEVDCDATVLSWNRFMVRHSGRGASEVVGHNLFARFPEIPEAWFRRKLDSVFALKTYAFTSWQQRPYLFRFPHNRPITGGVDCMRQDLTLKMHTSVTSFTVMHTRSTTPSSLTMGISVRSWRMQSTPPVIGLLWGNRNRLCITVKDVTDVCIYQRMLEQSKTEVERLSRTDALTGLYNRGHWQERFHEEFARASRYASPCSLVMFDLDHFKRINDTHGHLAGDQVLHAVAELLNQTLRVSDIAGRYGGEEFAVVLPETALAQALSVAERFRESLAAATLVGPDGPLAVSASLGVAQYKSGMDGPESLLRLADEALYLAKRRGRNRVQAAVRST